MATEVFLPKVDMVMEDATFIEWLKGEGDVVKKGEPLFVILTDKATMEIEAPASGILTGLKAQTDQIIPVSETIAYILSPGEQPPTAIRSASPSESAPTPTTHPKEVAIAEGSNLQVPESVDKVRATPVARRMATKLGIDLRTLQGRGPRGRIHRADILQAVEEKTEAAEKQTSIPTDASKVVSLQVPLPDARKKQVIQLDGPRKIIAQRMAYSAAVAPHINISVSVDMSEATRLRSRVLTKLKDRTGYRVSFTAIIARAVASTLPKHPYLNASLIDEEIVLWEDVHLGVATSLEDYLIVPVIREAQGKSLEQMIVALGDLLERARLKRLPPSEMSGSTFTITNLGMFGIESFTAIINPPESAILAVGKTIDTYVKVDDEMVERPMMNLTLSADHRIIDGVSGANFLIELKTTLENPYLLI
jgi:pyruvate dehydrogenase E2 component (dihydrolipoamide acetyltransferase)